jgi:hypothetical protein
MHVLTIHFSYTNMLGFQQYMSYEGFVYVWNILCVRVWVWVRRVGMCSFLQISFTT